jgi:phosphoserine phosphatase
LLKLVDNPIVVDPDDALLAIAQQSHWQIIKFRV